MGHRAEKQKRQRQEIIANAIALTQEGGLASCRVQVIAAKSGISTATFFNYFPTKESVLQEWLDDQPQLLFEGARDQHAQGAALRRALRRVAQRLAEWAVAKPAACRAAAQCYRSSEAVAGLPARGRAMAAAPGLRLIEQARDRDEIRGDIEPKLAAMVLRLALIGGLAEGLEDDSVEASGSLQASLRSLVDLWVDGLRKRNERVPSAAGSRRRLVTGRADS